MSVAGFDIGDQCSCIAVARKRGIDVLMNKESKRETPSIAAFNSKQRLLGTAAVGSLSTSPKNTVFQIKRLLGKKFSNPDVQRDIAKFPFEVTEGSDGNCLITVDYLGEKTQLTAEQLLAMVLVDQKEIAETDGSPVTDCVISVPTYFTEAERYAALNAAQIAGVNCLRLFNDTTSTALAYGIYKTDLPETEPSVVAFVDIGYSALQVSHATVTRAESYRVADLYFTFRSPLLLSQKASCKCWHMPGTEIWGVETLMKSCLITFVKSLVPSTRLISSLMPELASGYDLLARR